MIVIGMGLVWSGYTLTYFGYTLLHNMGVSLADLVIPGKYPYKGALGKARTPTSTHPLGHPYVTVPAPIGSGGPLKAYYA